jgi:hypothetical protein
MSILNKSLLAVALIATTILPAAADAVIDDTYNKEQMERYSPNARSSTLQTRDGFVAPTFFLQDRRSGNMYSPAPASRDVPAGG